ncbi:MAG: hypothetical protein ACYC63_07350 [Armatimonadota bacterium]
MGERIVTVKLDDGQLEELRRRFPNGDDAALVEHAIEECLRQRPHGRTGKSPLLSMIGMLQGDKDVSARHDEFGAGADPA